MKDIPSHLWHDSYVRVGEKKTGGPNLRLLRLDPDLPSNTITAYIFNKFVHPNEDRYITPREAARLQQFPDDHEFAGPITNVQLQIGNAVPVSLARSVAGRLHERLISRSPTAQLNAVSLFSGAGGMDLGFKDFFHIESANELVPNFAETLRNNFSGTNIINTDITNLSGKDLAEGEVDVVFGGPPCQPFSAAGRHRGVEDPRGGLVKEYLRVVADLQPSYFVMENVPGLVSNAKGGALRFIKEQANKTGYSTEHYVLSATDYGVPQRRSRLFVIGRRDPSDLPLGQPLPTHASPGLQGDLLLNPCATVRDAFAGLDYPQPRVSPRGHVKLETSPAISAT